MCICWREWWRPGTLLPCPTHCRWFCSSPTPAASFSALFDHRYKWWSAQLDTFSSDSSPIWETCSQFSEEVLTQESWAIASRISAPLEYWEAIEILFEAMAAAEHNLDWAASFRRCWGYSARLSPRNRLMPSWLWVFAEDEGKDYQDPLGKDQLPTICSTFEGFWAHRGWGDDQHWSLLLLYHLLHHFECGWRWFCLHKPLGIRYGQARLSSCSLSDSEVQFLITNLLFLARCFPPVEE